MSEVDADNCTRCWADAAIVAGDYQHHPFSSMSEVDADNRRQQLRRQPNSECQGKEERVQNRTCQIDVDGKDSYHHHQRDFHEEITELPYAPLKVRFRRPEF